MKREDEKFVGKLWAGFQYYIYYYYWQRAKLDDSNTTPMCRKPFAGRVCSELMRSLGSQGVETAGLSECSESTKHVTLHDYS